MKAWFLAGLLALVALAPVFGLAYYYGKGKDQEKAVASVQFDSERHNKRLEPGAELTVRSCKVLDGFRFQMFLEGNRRIEAHLATATKDGSSKVVIELLQEATSPPPTVVLLRQISDYWIVDFRLTVDGQRSSVLDLLKAEGMLL